jgi:superfamily II DNA or RNA helicase
MSRGSDDYSSDDSSRLSSETEQLDKILGINSRALQLSSRFYVKMLGESYAAARWLSRAQLFSLEKGRAALDRFAKYTPPFRRVPFLPDPPVYKPLQIDFKEDYTIAERVIAERSEWPPYLVKWGLLEHCDCTWEPSVTPRTLIEQFRDSQHQRNPRRRKPWPLPRGRDHRILLESPEYKNQHRLTPFQLGGLNWLNSQWYKRQNSILADEMGLGKTIQVLAHFEYLRAQEGLSGPYLVVAPLSTVPNWVREIEEWTDFRAVAFTGNEKSRSLIKKYCVLAPDGLIVDIIVISYELLCKESRFLNRFSFIELIVDEAHRIKNIKSATFKRCSDIVADTKILLTGTPVQNSHQELWSLLLFINQDAAKGVSYALASEEKANLDAIRTAIRPFLLRRKKADVDLPIGVKEETIIEVELTHEQRMIYRLLLNDNRQTLIQQVKSKISLRNIAMELRKVCCHPYLNGLDDIWVDKYLTPSGEIDHQVATVNSSGKMILLDKLLPKLQSGGHKILLFSQMTKMLDIIEDYLIDHEYVYERLDGNTSVTLRKMSIDRFTNETNIFIFLLSTRAGGFGINLIAADTVIIYDSDWNPQNDIQAQSRCHRFGQTKDVQVYRLITRETYESAMFQRSSKKLAVDFALLDANFDGDVDEEEVRELDMILKNGAYYIFNEETDELNKFCSEDIDQILEHRTHIVNRDLVSGGNSLFAKVSFDAGTLTDADLEMPDFWNRILPPLPEEDVRCRAAKLRRLNYDDERDDFEDDPADGDFTPPAEESPPSPPSPPLPPAPPPPSLPIPASLPHFPPPGVTGPSVNWSVASDCIEEFKRVGYTGLRYVIHRAYIDTAYAIVEALLIRTGRTVQNPFPVSVHVNPFDRRLDQVFQDKEEEILTRAVQGMKSFQACLNLANSPLPDNLVLAPYMPMTPTWSILEDYCIAMASGVFNKLEMVLRCEYLPFCAMDPDILPPKNRLMKRISLLYGDISMLIRPRPVSDYTLRSPGDWFKANAQRLCRRTFMTRIEQMRLLRVMYLVGIPLPDPVAKLSQIAKLGHISEGTIADFLNGFLSYVPDPFLAALRQGESSFDFWWVPLERMQDVVRSVSILAILRRNMTRIMEAAALWPPWSAAPSWWTRKMDSIVIWLAHLYGFLFFSEICRSLGAGTRDNSAMFATWKAAELKTLTPRMHATGTHLAFLFPIAARIERLEQLARLAQVS